MAFAVNPPAAHPPAVGHAACASRDAGRLLALARLLERPADHEQHWSRVADGIAGLLDAPACAILFSDSDSGSLRRHASRDAAVPGGEARAMLVAPITVADDTLGMVQVYDAPRAAPSDADRVATLRLLALLVGQSVLRARMRKLLESRFAQWSLAQSQDPRGDAALREAVGRREGIGRLVARSLYREMTRAGFDASDIVCSASELITQLSEGLKRRGRKAAPARRDAEAPAGCERRAA